MKLSEKRQTFVLRVLFFVCLLVIVSMVGTKLTSYLKTKPATIDKTTLSLQQQLDKYRLNELQQKKPAEPPKLDPKIINKELEKVGKLIVFTGKMVYNEPVENKGFLWRRKLDLQLTYNFGIAIDLAKIQIEEVAPNVVSLKIPRQEIELAYVELDANNSIVDGQKSMFAKQFDAGEMKVILGFANESITKKVEADKDIYNKSVESLKQSLEQLVMKLGFRKAVFEEV